MMFKKNRIVLCQIAVLGLFACGENSSNTPTTLDKAVNIGISHCCSKDDVYMYKIYEDIQKAAKSYSAVRIQALAANEDKELQEKQVQQLIDSNIDALVLRLVIDNSKDFSFYRQILKMTQNAGIPVVLYVVNVDAKNFYDFQNVYYVGSIPAQSGILQGEVIVKGWQAHPEWDLNGDGVIQYVILKGPLDNPDAEGRTSWVSATIQNYPGKGIQAELLDLKVANFRREQAYKQVNAWLDTPLKDKVEVIIANNDDMAMGAVNALKENGKKLPVFGVDALPEALHAIKNGDMAGTILQNASAQAKETLNLAVNLAAKRALTTGTEYKVIARELMVPYIVIDKDNFNQFIK